VIPERLQKLELRTLPDGTRALVAERPLARLLGLAWLDEPPADCALLLPRCRSVHTFGMRFALDVSFLDARGHVIAVIPAVPPRRVVGHRRAAAVLERPARPRH
jgi:hypothetical protein